MSPDGNTLERMRADLIRRARMERHGDLEQGSPRGQEMAESEQTPSRFGRLAGLSRPGLPRLFGRREERPSGQDVEQPGVLESPKPPEFNARAGRSPLNRFTLPNVSQIWPGRLLGRESHADADPAGAPRPVSPDRETWEMPLPPEPATHARSTIRAASSYYSTTEESGSTETNPSSQERDERRQRRQRRRRRRRQHEAMWYGGRRTRGRKTPKRFLYCFPWVQSQRMRAYILRCLVSGFFLVALLTIYLGLSVSDTISVGDFTIVLVLVVILATLFFSYGLGKLCLFVIRRDRARQDQTDSPVHVPGHGYAVPTEPIRVVLARDEEVAGMESEMSKVTPPAYGVWRESVRVDPDRLFWQRNENVSEESGEERPQTSASRRPPSYISDDGVSYVVDAVPRSVAPSSTSLPLHPSETEGMTETRPPW